MKHIKIVLITIALLIVVVSGTVHAQDDEYTVGILTSSSQFQDVVDGFLEGMADLGYVEGKNITFVFGGPPEESETLLEVAQALVAANVDVILASATPEAQMLMGLTTDIPIVFALAPDPVGAGLVEDLTEPGGNVTGIVMSGYHERRLQILLEMDPTIEEVYYPYNPESPTSVALFETILETADELGVEIVVAEITDVASLYDAIENVPEDIDAIFFPPENLVFFPDAIPQWIAISMQYQAGWSLPTYSMIQGALMGYGPDVRVNGQQAAGIVDRILRGADPADLPVENAEYFLAVNLEAAMMIGLDIPRGILRQADLIIRPGDFDTDQ